MNKIIFSQKDISTVVERMTSDEMIQGVELAPQGSKERRAPQGSYLATWPQFTFMSSKITVDGDCSHEIKRRLLLE